MPLISPRRFSATILAERLGQGLERACAVDISAGLEGVFALQFQQRPDVREDFGDLIFVHVQNMNGGV